MLYDAWSVMDQPAFWPAYLLDAIDDEDLLADVWRVSPDVIEETGNRLMDPAAWPVFEVELGADAVLAVIIGTSRMIRDSTTSCRWGAMVSGSRLPTSRGITADPGDVETLAELIATDNRFFEAARWSMTPDGLICDAYYARRTPAMPREARRAVTDALGGGG